MGSFRNTSLLRPQHRPMQSSSLQMGPTWVNCPSFPGDLKVQPHWRTTELQRWFSGVSRPKNHLEGLLNQMARLHPVWNGAWELAFLTGSWVTLRLLVQGPHREPVSWRSEHRAVVINPDCTSVAWAPNLRRSWSKWPRVGPGHRGLFKSQVLYTRKAENH